jgi:hypothetical protein
MPTTPTATAAPLAGLTRSPEAALPTGCVSVAARAFPILAGMILQNARARAKKQGRPLKLQTMEAIQ